VDGIVFVADSQTAMLDANRESLQNLRDNLRELGLDLNDIPMIFQWNKRDLKNIVPIETLERELNAPGKQSFQSIASDGTGVFETLRGITKLALANIKALHLAEAAGAKAAPKPMPEPTALHTSEFSMPDELPDATDPSVAPEALNTLDLPSTRDLFGEDETSAGRMPAPPATKTTGPRALPSPVQVMAPMRVKLAPGLTKGLPAMPRVNLKAPPAPLPHKAASPVARPAHMAMPKAPTAKSHADLHVNLSPFAMDGEVEVVVTILQNGAEVGHASLLQPAPAWGGSGTVSVEIKRT